MAFAWGKTANTRRGIPFRVHLGNRVFSIDRENWIEQEDNGKKKEK
jgi:hypothetical protein